MKINLKLGGEDKNGYLNIDGLKGMELRNLDEYADDAECFEILAEDILDYIPRKDIEFALNNWASKIRHQGTLVIGGTEAKEISKLFANGALSVEQWNMSIHGVQNEDSPWDVKLNQFTLEKACDELESRGLVVTKKRVNGLQFVVEGERS